MAKATGPKKRAGRPQPPLVFDWTDGRRRVAVPDVLEAAVIDVYVRELCRAFFALGQNDAAMALMRLHDAVEDGDPILPARLYEAADPWTARGRRPTRGTRLFKTITSFVEVVREEPPIKSDDAIVEYVVRAWIEELGAPPRATTDRPGEYARLVLQDEARTARMVKLLQSGDAAAFVKGVHRELGYSGTNNLANAETKRKSRQVKARRSRRRGC